MRDAGDTESETGFHLMLVEIEHLALLANNDAVQRLTQVYMLGSYAKHLLGLLTAKERESMFWELAVGYLDGLARDTDRYKSLTGSARARFWRRSGATLDEGHPSLDLGFSARVHLELRRSAKSSFMCSQLRWSASLLYATPMSVWLSALGLVKACLAPA